MMLLSNKMRPELVAHSIALLEESSSLFSAEKLNILRLLLGQKWIADFSLDNGSEAERITTELDKLGLFYYVDSYMYEDGSVTQWLQVAISSEILKYIRERKDVLTSIEAGLLYGYPVSAVLAFEGLINDRARDRSHHNVVSYYLSGVHSTDYYPQEREEMVRFWGQLEQASPRIVREVTEYVMEMKQGFSSEKE